MTRQRDALGRFAPGNTISRLGWAGLVDKRFGGDETMAKQWLGRVGFHAYARMALEETPNAHKLQFSMYRHPGTPEEFLAEFRFSLTDVASMQF